MSAANTKITNPKPCNQTRLAALRMSAANTKKMQIPVGSPEEGTVVKVYVAAEQFVNEGDAIVEVS